MRSSESVVPTPSYARPLWLVVLGTAAVMFVYEAVKTAILPRMSLWESHAITIVFSSIAAAWAARGALREQARLHHKALEATVSRERLAEVHTRLEERTRALEASEEGYRLLVERSPEAIAIHASGSLLYVNDTGVALLGVESRDALVGASLTSFVHPDYHPQLREAFTKPPAPGGTPDAVEYQIITRDGRVLETESLSVPVMYGGRRAVQTVIRDVTARRELERRLTHQAFHDSLTNLANRALFNDRVAHALAHAERGDRIAVLFLDLDNFKTVNDSLGHAAGDVLLQAVAGRLLKATRGCDTVARLGGDEFGILLESMTQESDALTVVSRVTAALAAPVSVNGVDVTICASTGVAYARGQDSADALIRNADVAMYQAKELGNGCHAVFEPVMYTAIVERLEMERALRGAMTRGELRLMYQPVVRLDDGVIEGVEALLRWEHPTRGVIAPAVFIPIAEETGAIVAIGRWVLAEACRQLRMWDADTAGAFPINMAVNISGRQLDDPALVDEVARVLDAHDIAPRRLTLEFTESVIMRRTEATINTLHALKRLGVRLAIDDFGTGYSSLSYLQRFPVDTLKIDKAFVDGITHGGSAAALAKAIISLGDTLQLRTIAEGVEQQDQWNELRSLGCAFGQGYLFARPLGAAQVSALLETRDGVESFQNSYA